MRKKVMKPSSIRLTPAAEAWVSLWVQATGWSMSAVINHAIGLAIAVHLEERQAITTERRRAMLAAELKAVDEKAAAKKTELRAASKGAK
jgi:Arc/MetJ-type ribon-helix-helix transcriptional regulator